MNNFLLVLLILLTPLFSFSQSDDCVTAVSITPTLTNCNFQAGSSANATQSRSTCSVGGNADDDVWYTFVANSSSTTITVDPTVGYDAVIELFSGTCGLLTSIQCKDVNGLNGDEVLVNTGLIIGNTYFFRVYHYGSGSGTSTFNVCVKGLAPPTNNTPCNAYPLATVDPSCNFNIFTNLGSAGSSVPTPTGCGGSSPFQGGYAGGDVWFSVIVPPSGELDIHTLGVDFSDGAMALYSGPCGSPVLVECDDDGEPGDGILMPHIYRTGLTPGTTMYIRVWEYGNNNNGKFGICVSTPDNDDCANAQQICDLNGYGGITSSAYTIDFPSNMTGTGQNGIPNSNPTAPFGQGYIGSSPVQIDNNSWLQFTASATTATLFVQVNHCSNGNGMQMQIFSGTNCTNFTAVSSFLETQTSQSITATGLIPGNTYYIVIDGFAGDICSYTISATSGVQVVKAISSKAAVCLGDTATLSAQVIGTGSYTYSWSSNPPGLVSSAPSLTISPTQNTLYTVDVTGLCGSVTTASVYVTAHTPPTENLTASDTNICAGEVVNLNGNPAGGTTPYNHSWTGSGQPFLNSSTIATPNFTTTTAGNYILSYEVTDTIGCKAKDSLSITVNALPAVNITGDDTICNGESTTLIATGGGAYLWSNSSTLDSITVNPTANTNYTVTVTDANTCKDSATVNVHVNPSPTAIISGNAIICTGTSTSLLASGGNSYHWNTGDTNALVSFSPTVDTTYSVIVTNSSGCSDSTSIFVQVLPTPTASISGIDTICNGNSTTLTGLGGGTYSWNTGSNLTSINVSPTVDSTYSVIVDIGGCKDTAFYNVIVNPLPTVTITGDDTLCNGESTTLTATGGGSYLWNTSATSDSIIVSPSTTTNYNVTVTDSNNCINNNSYNVIVNPLPTITITGSTAICLGTSTNLTANGASSYLWNTSATTPSITVSPITNTTYSVVGTDLNGCSDSSQTTVTILPQPTALINGDSIICDGESATLNASGGGSYLWNTLDTTAVLTVNPTTTTPYTVIVNIGGCLDTTTYTVNVTPLPVINAYNDTTIILGQSAPIFAQANGPFTWTPTNGLSCTNCANPIAKPEETTTYCVETIENGCKNSSCVTVYVDILCGELFVPNAFSPNGDGNNDCLKVFNNCLETVLFRVYSRWGELIYESEDIDACWDGTNNGSDLNTGVYSFTVAAKLINGEEKELKGNTTLFK
jgi:gliding motility-associated-like protein